MIRFINVLLLTVLWAALFATLDLRALAFGAFVAWGMIAFSDRLHRDPEVERDLAAVPRPFGTALLIVAFIRELFLSAFSVAREAWRPRLAIRPGILAIPLDVETDIEVAVLASLISLTPGTLSMEVSPDRRTLFVHALIVEGDGEEVRRSIQDRLERPVRRAFRAPADR